MSDSVEKLSKVSSPRSFKKRQRQPTHAWSLESYLSNVVVMKNACVWVCLCCRTWMLTCGIPTRIWFRSHSRVWSSIASEGRKNGFIYSLIAWFLLFLFTAAFLVTSTFSLSTSVPSRVYCHVCQRQEIMSLPLLKEVGSNPFFTALTEGLRSSGVEMAVKGHFN